MLKAYIITTPCSGKSSLALKYSESACNISLIDQDNITSRLVRAGTIVPNAHENEKANTIINHLKSQNNPSILLGTYLPDNPLDNPEITIICVILPTIKHLYYVYKRRLRYTIYKILGFIPAYRNYKPNMKWSRWQNISQYRKSILAYSQNHNIPVFSDLKVAVHWLEQH